MPDERYPLGRWVPLGRATASHGLNDPHTYLRENVVVGRIVPRGAKVAGRDDIILPRADAEHFATSALRHLALVGCPICDRFRAAVVGEARDGEE